MDKLYTQEMKRVMDTGGPDTDPRRLANGIARVQYGQGIMQFCREKGIADKYEKFNRVDILTFMLWNSGTLEYYQDTGKKRELDKEGYPVIHFDEVFFCKNPLLFEAPQQIATFDFDTIKYYKHETLPDGWEWDIEHAFEIYNNASRRLENLYKTLPQYDEFGVASYELEGKRWYRIVKHKTPLGVQIDEVKIKHKKKPEVKQKNPTQKEREFKLRFK